MALFKCKMCGGELNIAEGMTVCECEYCGTKQTLPKLDDEKRLNLYERASHFRRNNEFDKASGFYETILSENETDAEAYWSLVLCKYGIEYVEDPTTHKRIPTVNRAQYTSVLIDEDYQSAMKYADGYQRDVYEAEAKAIDEIQKNILEISNKEEPFDVFICYKETNSDGSRTKDSIYAQEIYDALTKEGYRVFFSKITLEDKLGTAYEPYIFAALNSSKVMITVGTSCSNLNSVWVKNEWSRYLALIKNGEDKNLIPVYSDMDAYDLPDEFSYLQSQDRNKVGFMQDLVRGVKKLISQDVIDTRQKAGTTSVIVDTMTRRASAALANGEWKTAIRCYDSILDYDSKNVKAYLGKLMAESNVSEQKKLSDCDFPLDTNRNFQVLMEIADDKLKEELQNSNAEVIKKIKAKNNKKLKIRVSIISAIIMVGVIAFFGVYCFYPLSVYSHVLSLCEEGNYTDSYELIESMDNMTMLAFLRNKTETAKIEIKYQEALNLMNEGKYDSAQTILKANPEYGDSQNLILECMYLKGLDYLKESRFDTAITTFTILSNQKYKDSDEKLDEARTGQEKSNQELLEKKYQYVTQHKTNTDSTTVEYMEDLLSANYKDSKSIQNELDVIKLNITFNGSDSENVSSLTNTSVLYGNVEMIEGPVNTSKTFQTVFTTSYNDQRIKNNITIYGCGSSESVSIVNNFGFDLADGKYTLTVYDENGNYVTSKSINIYQDENGNSFSLD